MEKTLQPNDIHNQTLVQHVHPQNWKNKTPSLPYHLVVIGAGTAGLVTAAGAAGLGARVALVERNLMGGDCLNVGCVPSKALIASGRIARTLNAASEWGITSAATSATANFGEVMQRMRRLRAEISPHDSADRFAALGVDVFLGNASFRNERTIQVESDQHGSATLSFHKAVIATGARAAVPDIPGIQDVPFLTNENLFELTNRPDQLAIIGGGPIGCEMAQAFSQLGTDVTLFQRSERILPRDDIDAANVVLRRMEQDGVQVRLRCSINRVELSDSGRIRLHVSTASQNSVCEASHLLVATGRTPNLNGLNLEAASVVYSSAGLTVDAYARTSNHRIFAAGDVCSSWQFTHAADFQARAVIQNALFAIGPLGRKRTDRLLIPRTTYTSPELASIGLSADQADSQGISHVVLQQDFSGVDRAILDGDTDGFVKVILDPKSGQILGATVVGSDAGNLISELTLAMQNKLTIAQVGNTIHPYPTTADAIRKLGDQWNRKRLTPQNQRLLALLLRWNVGR
ncbi:MAG: mercuric reductase [Planctomycetales bacterium]|nr:mercuric reductase [Planctomycetales bacterium]